MADPDGTSERSLGASRPATRGPFGPPGSGLSGGSPPPSRPHIGAVALTPYRLVLGVAFVGSAVFIAYAVVVVRDASQIPMLSAGFAVLGLATAAIALAAVIGLWRAAAAGRNGRALALAILGGVLGLGAISCFTLTVLLALLWRSS